VGRAPFAGPAGEILAKQIYEEPPALAQVAPGVPDNLVDLVNRLIRKNKTERPTMKQVAQELEQMAIRHPTTAHSIIRLPLPVAPVEPPASGDPSGIEPAQEVDAADVVESTEEAPTNPSIITNQAQLNGVPEVNPGLLPQSSTLGFSVGQSSM